MTTCFSDSWKTVTSHLCHCGPSAHLNLHISRFTQFTDHRLKDKIDLESKS